MRVLPGFEVSYPDAPISTKHFVGLKFSLSKQNVLFLCLSPLELHCKYLNARFECNDIVISVYSHYPFDQNAKTFDTKGKTFSIR